jgi:hypothetical protein
MAMIRNIAQALILVVLFLFILAEVQELDDRNQTAIWSPQ